MANQSTLEDRRQEELLKSFNFVSLETTIAENVDWLDSFTSYCTPEDMQKAAILQGPRTYSLGRFQNDPQYYYTTSNRTNIKTVISTKSRNRSVKRNAYTKPWIATGESSILPSHVLHPPFKYYFLGLMALLNSPRKEITVSEMVTFARHHFPFYRYSRKLKQTLRTAVNGCKLFKLSDRKEFNHQHLYCLKMEVDPWKLLDLSCLDYIKEDVRGEEFYSRMFSGELGLPRQLFYHIVGNRIPSLAGPENSALFYHLLGIKHISEQSSHLFQVHWTTKESGIEPKFVEEYVNFTADYLSHPENLTSFGEALGSTGIQKKMTMEETKMFLANIGRYFELQKNHKARGVASWATPNAIEVDKLLQG
ncbi:unnamed protein product [Caenorhabditis brenneri]